MYIMSLPITELKDIKHCYYINLENRPDRRDHIENQLLTMDLKGERFNAIKMENGAIGCSMSHLKILQNAFENKLDYVLILEDDITFLNPDLFKEQFKKFIQLHKNNWDVVLFAGNNIPPYEKTDESCIKVSRCLTTTGYLVNGNYIKNLINNIRIGLTNLIHNPSKRNLYAIDTFWFVLQNTGNWYLIIPASVIQKDDYSDIEKKRTNYKNIMLDIDKTEYIRKTKEIQSNRIIQNTFNNILTK